MINQNNNNFNIEDDEWQNPMEMNDMDFALYSHYYDHIMQSHQNSWSTYIIQLILDRFWDVAVFLLFVKFILCFLWIKVLNSI